MKDKLIDVVTKRYTASELKEFLFDKMEYEDVIALINRMTDKEIEKELAKIN